MGCSVCHCRLLESDIGFAQGTGCSLAEEVLVVECASCRSRQRSFHRERVTDGEKVIFSRARLAVEQEPRRCKLHLRRLLLRRRERGPANAQQRRRTRVCVQKTSASRNWLRST